MASILSQRTRAQEEAYFNEENGEMLRRLRERMEREGRLPASAAGASSSGGAVAAAAGRDVSMRRVLRRGVQYGWPTSKPLPNRVVQHLDDSPSLDLSQSGTAIAAQAYRDLYRGRFAAFENVPAVPTPRHANSARAKEAAERAMRAKAPAVMVAVKAFGIASAIVTGAAMAGLVAFQVSMGTSNLADACLKLAENMKPRREAALEALSPLRDRVKAFAAAQQMSVHDKANLGTAFGGLKIDAAAEPSARHSVRE